MGLGDAEKAADFFQDALRDRPMSSRSAALAGMAQVHAARGNKDAAFMLLRRAYLEPSFTDFGPFVDVLSRIGELNRWTSVAAELGVRKELLHDLRLAVFSHYERAGRIADAFGLVVASPEVVSPVNPQRNDIGPKAAISFARIRALAKKSGEYPKAIELLEAVRNSGAPDLEPELAMLKAEWSIAKGEPDAATPELVSAAKLRPLNWEYVRRAALALISAKRNADAAQALERFISAQTSAVERDAAIELWGATRKP
jgi:tetratricopeptide (TPR) repeat protein